MNLWLRSANFKTNMAQLHYFRLKLTFCHSHFAAIPFFWVPLWPTLTDRLVRLHVMSAPKACNAVLTLHWYFERDPGNTAGGTYFTMEDFFKKHITDGQCWWRCTKNSMFTVTFILLKAYCVFERVIGKVRERQRDLPSHWFTSQIVTMAGV